MCHFANNLYASFSLEWFCFNSLKKAISHLQPCVYGSPSPNCYSDQRVNSNTRPKCFPCIITELKIPGYQPAVDIQNSREKRSFDSYLQSSIVPSNRYEKQRFVLWMSSRSVLLLIIISVDLCWIMLSNVLIHEDIWLFRKYDIKARNIPVILCRYQRLEHILIVFCMVTPTDGFSAAMIQDVQIACHLGIVLWARIWHCKPEFRPRGAMKTFRAAKIRLISTPWGKKRICNFETRLQIPDFMPKYGPVSRKRLPA